MQDEALYFETIKCLDGRAYHLSYHNQRVARTISLNINLQEYILPISDAFLKCKVLYDEYGVLDVLYEPYNKREIKSFKVLYDDTLEYSKKSVNRDCIDDLFKQKGQADEIIIIKNGLLCDTSIANLALFDGNNWLTPKTPLLQGTTRARLLENKELIEADLTLQDLKKAKKIALLNAMLGMEVLENYSLLS